MRLEFNNELTIGVIGLGYVGLPLAVEFGKKFNTVGYDINLSRLQELREGRDNTLEVTDKELATASRLSYSDSLDDLKKCQVYIVTVPTPINKSKQPDLSPLILASKTIANVLKQGDVVIYESTVYPGATEEDCVPVLENGSGWSLIVIFSVVIARKELTQETKNIESALY